MLCSNNKTGWGGVVWWSGSYLELIFNPARDLRRLTRRLEHPVPHLQHNAIPLTTHHSPYIPLRRAYTQLTPCQKQCNGSRAEQYHWFDFDVEVRQLHEGRPEAVTRRGRDPCQQGALHVCQPHLQLDGNPANGAHISGLSHQSTRHPTWGSHINQFDINYPNRQSIADNPPLPHYTSPLLQLPSSHYCPIAVTAFHVMDFEWLQIEVHDVYALCRLLGVDKYASCQMSV